MRLEGIVAIAFALCTARSAAAADCAGRLPETGHPVELKTPLTDAQRDGFAESLIYGLSSDLPNWPMDQIAKAPPCPLADFKARETAYSLSGGLGSTPVRWAASKSDGWVAFLAALPSIEDGIEAKRSGTPAHFKPKHMMFVLVVANEGMRHVVRLYDGVPDATTLTADMTAGLEARLAPIADFDSTGYAVSIDVPTSSPVGAVLWSPLPGEGGPTARTTAPDGRLFTAGPDGAIAMAGSGFVCPSSYGVLHRMDMWIVDATEKGRDLTCRYTSPAAPSAGWVSISVTRYPARPSARWVFDKYVGEGHAAAPAAAAIQPPIVQGARPGPAFADAWRDKQGADQAVWVSSIGVWYVRVRATYEADQAADIGKAVAGIFEEAYRVLGAGSPTPPAPAR